MVKCKSQSDVYKRICLFSKSPVFKNKLINYRELVVYEQDGQLMFAPDIWAAFTNTDVKHFECGQGDDRKSQSPGILKQLNFTQVTNAENEYQRLIKKMSEKCLDIGVNASFWKTLNLTKEQVETIINSNVDFPSNDVSLKFWVANETKITNMIQVSDITKSIRFTDQIYGTGHEIAPVMSFSRGNRKHTTYNNTALNLINWDSDYIAQYVPMNTPQEGAKDLAGRICSIVSIYPKSGRTYDYAKEEAWKLFNLEKWPDAIMLREVFYFVEPPLLKDIYSDYKSLSSLARGKLGRPTEELYEALSDLEVYPVHNLYRSKAALDYIKTVENNSNMQIVLNRRNGKAGYVYALELKEFPELLKIGSAFDVSTRISGLSTGIPVDFECIADFFSEDCRSLEREIHKVLDHARVRADREWFKCTKEDFYNTINKVKDCY